MKKSKADECIRKLGKKIWINEMIRIFFHMFLLGTLAFFSCMLLGHIRSFVYPLKKGMKWMAGLLLLGLVIGLCKRPTARRTARIGDDLGLEDRLKTYLEYKGEQDPVAVCFKEEVENTLETFALLKKYPLQLPVKEIFLSIFILILSFGFSLIPSKGWEAAQEKVKIHTDLKEESQKLQELERQVKEAAAENRESKEEEAFDRMISTIQELEKDLQNTFSYEEGALQVGEAQEKMRDCQRRLLEKDAAVLAGIFQGMEKEHPLLALALASGNPKEGLELLKSESFTRKEQEKILENLKDLDRKLDEEENPVLKEALQQIQSEWKQAPLKGEKLADRLEAIPKRPALQIAEQALFQLESIKERTLAKGEAGFKSIDGAYRGANLAEGQNESLGAGEPSYQPGNEMAMGNQGSQRMDQAAGVGGNSGKASGEKGISRRGIVEKQETATRLDQEEGQKIYTQGEWTEKGNWVDRRANRVIEIEGESQTLAYLRRSFKKEGMNYVLKQEIPMEYRQLVLSYFEKIKSDL